MRRLKLFIAALVAVMGLYGQGSTVVSVPLSSETALESGVVTGVPFLAEATTEITQAFPDGNRIVRSSKSVIARDSLGRTRREQNLSSFSSLLEPAQVTFTVIRDPVARIRYVIRPDQRVVERDSLPLLQARPAEGRGQQDPKAGAEAARRSNLPEEARTKVAAVLAGSGPGHVTSTPLGKQRIEGVQATGTRITRVIAAGEIGNEHPMTITSEVWYSPDLQVVVLSTQNDPRIGETTFKVSAIERREPPHAIFDIPTGYSIVDSAPPVLRR